MTQPKRPLKVFLCHASQDKPIVRELHDRLLSEGWIDPWLDKEKLHLGEDFDLEIEKAIESTDAVIAFISENAVKKTGYIQKELRLVYDAQMYRPDGELFTIPLRLEECEPPHRFKYWHWGDYFGEEKEKTYQSLLNSLKFIHERVLKSEAAEKTRLEVEELKRQKKEAKEKTEREAKEKRETHKKEEKPAIVKSKAGSQTIYWFGGFVVLVLGIIFISLLNNPPSTSQPTPENIQEQVVYTSTETEIVMPSTTSTFTLTSSPIIVITSTDTLTPTSYPSKIVDSKEVPMAFVPPGEFIMGSENGDTDAKSVHSVYLNSFYIDIYEVTNAFYKKCISDNNACSEPNSGYYQFSDYADHPVVNVTWFQADQYCRWRGGSLPTEAQWEKAARGTDGRTYPWGEEAGCNRANYHTCVGTTAKVGSYENGRSPYDIYDMAGNVWEWVSDWYDDNYYQYSPPSNPTGPITGKSRILRGGSWSYPMNDLPTYNRREAAPNSSRNVIGFRCVKDNP
ncbi:MAG: SUMF1/EgtB/PvdO family nonheme iron enzyme [Anaerolineales bacterium]